MSIAVDLTVHDLVAKMTAGERARLQAQLARTTVKDKGYLELPLGRDVRSYLAAKRKRLTDSSYRNYDGILHKLVIDHADLELEAFAPQAGTDLVERFMDDRYGDGSARAYNRNLSIVKDFFKWAQQRRGLAGDPTLLVERAKPHTPYRTTFTSDQRHAILASAERLRDRIALRLLLDYGIRKGALLQVQFQHFDHERRQIVIFTKGRKVRRLPIPDRHFWMDLERHILDTQAESYHYLMHRERVRMVPVGPPDADGHRHSEPRGVDRDTDRPMSPHACHDWWYRRLEDAGIVAAGTRSGERMHKARHTAGQRILDRSGNLKAVQQLLGHASIQTTADVYTDWDIDQLTVTLMDVLGDDSI